MKGTSPSLVTAPLAACGLRQQSATMERFNCSSTHLRGEVMAIVTIGIDLAKNVFAVHGVNEAGKPVLVKPTVARGKLLELIASLPPCTIGMEACSGAHHWARLFMTHGHTVRLMAPKFVGKRTANPILDRQRGMSLTLRRWCRRRAANDAAATPRSGWPCGSAAGSGHP